MDTEADPDRGLVAEVQRRLRLSRLVSGLTTSQASVTRAGSGDDFDVCVYLTPPDERLAEQIRDLFPDIRVQVKGAVARRL